MGFFVFLLHINAFSRYFFIVSYLFHYINDKNGLWYPSLLSPLAASGVPIALSVLACLQIQ